MRAWCSTRSTICLASSTRCGCATFRASATPMFYFPGLTPTTTTEKSGRFIIGRMRSVVLAAQAEAATAEPSDGNCREQEHALQFQRPAALPIERAQVLLVIQPDRDYHVDGNDQRCRAGEQAHDKQHGRDDFTHVDQVCH